MDIHPVNPGHALVIPKMHSALLEGVPEEFAARMFLIGRRVDQALRKSGVVRCEAVNLFLSDGQEAGQEVPHAHLHILPRYVGDGFGFRRPPGLGPTAGREALEEIARGLQTNIA